MDNTAIVSHLFNLYEKGLLTDTVINVSGKSFHVHRAILTQSGYFDALISGSWSSQSAVDEESGVLQKLEFEIDTHEESDITPEAVAQFVRYLYGRAPEITQCSARNLMMCASYFDVPSLSSLVADYVFSHLTYDNVISYLQMVYNREYGEPGKLIEDASFAFIYRNAVDIGASLAQLPLPQQKKVLMASELYVQTEFQRYKLALHIKRAYRERLLGDLGDVETRAIPAEPEKAAAPRQPLFDINVIQSSLWTTSVSEAEATPMHHLRGDEPEEFTFPAPGGLLSPAVKTLTPTAHMTTNRNVTQISPPASASTKAHAVSSRLPKVEVRSEPVPGARDAADVRAELREMEAAYKEIFESIRFVHFTQEQLAEVEGDGEIMPEVLEKAKFDQETMLQKVGVNTHPFNHYSITLSEFESMDDASYPDVQAVRNIKWPAFRFGVEVADVFSDAMKPTLEGEPLSTSSERVYFAGSMWCLDLKRYINRPDNTEYVAVYLRRRALRTAAPAIIPLLSTTRFEDTRDRTTLGFSIRLCGAPGAPTSNSVCGRSQMGKAFGTESETSWGWETYLTTANLTERPWTTGDKLRFMIVLDML